MPVSGDMQILDAFLSVVAFVFGTVAGSFVNVCIYRLPKEESIVKPRSRCPACGGMIAWYDNIPIISWLLLGAKCRHCGAIISWQYPLVEALTGTLFFFVYWRFGLALASPIYMVLCAALALVTFVDLTDWTIPNEVTVPGIPIGVGCSVIATYYPASGLHILGPFDVPVFNSLLGVVVGFASLYLLDKVSLLLLNKRGMGLGDAKLLAMLGAFFGPWGVLLMIIMGSIVGSIVGITSIAVQKHRGVEDASHYLPFGPYLALSGVIVMLFGAGIIALYQDFITNLGPVEPLP